MTGQYASNVEDLIERYCGRVQPGFSRGVRSAFSAGESGLAAAELASALVLGGIAVAPEDKVLFQELLRKIELSPDMADGHRRPTAGRRALRYQSRRRETRKAS